MLVSDEVSSDPVTLNTAELSTVGRPGGSVGAAQAHVGAAGREAQRAVEFRAAAHDQSILREGNPK